MTTPAIAPTTALTAVPAAAVADPVAAVKPADGAAAAVEVKPDAAAAVAADIELKFADGAQVDAELITGFKSLAKEFGLKSEQAQKIADLNVKAQQAAVAKETAAFEAQRKDWATASQNHKEFGGAKFKESMAVAHRAIAKFGSPELSKLLDATGLGDHPEFVAAFVKIGNAMREDSIASTVSNGSAAAPSREAQLRAAYPSMFKTS